MKNRRKSIFIILAVLIISFISVWIYRHNTTITTTHYIVSSEILPESFEGFTIVQVSDLHNDVFGKDNADLFDAIRSAAPDIIVLTGDILDSYHTKLEIACAFINEISDIAPVYYTTGNHEYRLPITFAEFEQHMINSGVTVLRNKSAEIQRNGETITISGAEDPDFSGIEDFKDTIYFKDRLSKLKAENSFTLLLSHRPDIFDVYCSIGADLVLTGHAHGGQFRLPLLGAVTAPQQGLFPDFTEGLFEHGNTTMIVSRGLGNSAFPFRINNPPELVVVTLETE